MGTRGRVPRVNVTSTNIRYVADIDYNLGQGMVTSDQLFQDNDIRGEYIDPDYCEGETDNDRLTVFQDKPLHSGEWRNYGGETIDPEGIPEIYFKNIIGKPFDGGSNIELAPQTPETQQYLVDNDLIIGVAVPPKLLEVDNYTSQAVVDSKMLVDLTQSAMLRDGNENVLNDSDLAVRVGLDYPNGSSTVDAVFSYNVTVDYGDIPISFSVKEGSEFLSHVSALFVPKFKDGTQSVEAIANGFNIQHLFDYLSGGNVPVLKKVNDSINKIFESAGETLAGTLLQGIALYTTMILMADAIWNFFLYPTKATDGVFQYKNLIDGMYTFQDVSKSKYQIGLGTRFTGNTGLVSKFISPNKDQNIHTAAMNSVVYPPTVQFEGSLLGVQKYANFKFFPKCNQYDLMTPPPIITYKIELEAISGCVLSSTKPTAFVVSIAPDKYQAPIFDVITPRGRASVSRQDVYINDPIVFQNARYVDFLALLDLDKSSGFLGLFPTYENRYINTDGDDMSQFNMHIPVTESDIATTGGIAFGGVTYPAGGGLSLYPAQSTYDAVFMQEAQGNIIKNPTFRLEQSSSDPDDPTYLLKKFWNYDASWEIRDGSIYRDTTSNLLNGIWQQVPLFREIHESRGKYYFLDVDCTVDQSYLAIELAGAFRYGLCNWLSSDSYYNHAKYERKFLLSGDYPPNVTLVGTQIRISATGKYKLLLRVSNPSNNILKIIPDYSYTGRINYLSLQYIPTVSIDDGARLATNALTKYNQPRLQLRWMDAVIQSKSIELKIRIEIAPTFYIKFRPLQSEYEHYTITIDWGDGGSPTVYSDLIYQEYVEFKNYFWPGEKTITITCVIPGTGYNLQNLFESFGCNETELVKYTDNGGLVSGGELDLSGSNVGLHKFYPSLNYMTTESFTTPQSTLDLAWTPMSGNCDKLHIVTDYLDISGTQVSGDLTSLFDIDHVNASNSKITVCSGSTIPTGEDGNKTIIWKDCGMAVDQLYNLVRAIDLSNIEEGYLDIKGSNPAIVDQVALDRITMLTTNLGEDDGLGGIGRGWTILYNASVASLSNAAAVLIYNEDLDQYELTIGYQLYIGAYDPTSVLYFDIYDADDNLLETVSRSFTSESPNVWIIPVDSLQDEYVFSPTLYTLTVNNGIITT